MRLELTLFSCNTIIVFMKNVTITLDEKVAAWARIRAAEKETSLSRLVGEMLREKMLADETYQTSMKDFLSKSPCLIKNPGTKYPKREKVYER